MDSSRWIEVDLDKVIHNYMQVRQFLSPDAKLLAVVKANAYGLGMVPVAQVLARHGADAFGVTYLEEALKLRQAGISQPILIFSPVLAEQLDQAVKGYFRLTVSSVNQVKQIAQAAEAAGVKAAVHLKVETGMGRTGIFPQQALAVAKNITAYDSLVLEGIYTHFSAATENKITRAAYDIFTDTVKLLKESGIDIPLAHCCNSAAVVRHPDMHLSMVRVGTLLYGQYPGGVGGTMELHDPWQARCKVLYLRRVPKGTTVGYGQEFTARQDTYIGVIPMGFADGYAVTAIGRAKSWFDLFKMLVKTTLAFLGKSSGELQVRHKDITYPVVGRVGMQLSMVDFGDNAAVDVGEELSLTLRRVTAAETMERKYFLDGSKLDLPEDTVTDTATI